MNNKAVIGLGTNMGHKIENIQNAVRAIGHLPNTEILAASHVYETDPVGFADQDVFLNAAVNIQTKLSPMALLGACLGIEAAFGRERSQKDGPRIIDLDLLLYGCVKSESFELTLPHPRILKRAFVMVPLLDLFPGGRAPGLYFGPHLKEVGCEGVRKIDLEITV
ncbi:MAG: 2-amino-4-hydroxy-6-hydroxymethyldihydropteridine diphosphokinase [Clostridiales bacterium]|nr:2-amino-4-hydroxy-6-hydroxymethyldihydropteridine diphosphokinase [Clostridiales bacterium]